MNTGMTLGLYFAGRYLRECLRVFLIVTLIIFMIDMLDHVARFASRGATLADAMILAGVRTPHILGQALPLVAMLGSLSFCVGLARSSEFVVTRAAGQSALRSLVVPAICSFVLGSISVLIFEPGAARLDDTYFPLRAQILNSKARSAPQVTDSGLWLRQSTPTGHSVINAATANGDGSVLSDVTIWNFDVSGKATTRQYAETSFLQDGQWIFWTVKTWDVSGQTENPETEAATSQAVRMPTDITAEQILEGYPTPDRLPLWRLPGMIDTMERAGFSSLPHRIHMMMQVAKPFLFVAMMIIGAVFTLQTARLGNLGVSVLFAILFGFALYFLQNLARTLGEAGELPVLLASLAPPLAALLLAIGLFLHFEDG